MAQTKKKSNTLLLRTFTQKISFFIGIGSIIIVIVVVTILFNTRSSQTQNSQPNAFAANPSNQTSKPSFSNKWNKHWLIAQSAAVALNKTSEGIAFIQSINNASTYEIIPHPLQTGNDPLSHATHIETFQSYQSIQSAFATNQIPSNVRVILYDNESWPGTPLIEQQRPFTYVPLAEKLVHQHGLLFMNAPAADLKAVLAPSASNNYSGYLQVKLATLAKYTDIFEIQAQNAPSLATYLSFAKQAIRQARSANPHAVLLVGITAKLGGPSSQTLFEEVRDLYNFTDGYWFNIIGGTEGTAIALPVIQQLQQQY